MNEPEKNEQKVGYVFCPFCGEVGFDKTGLKLHLEMGWCDVYTDTPVVDEEE